MLAARCLALAGALVLAGCSIGGGSQAREEQEITKADLARMVVPRDELGTVAAGLRTEVDAGPVGNAEAADGSLDPDDTERILAGLGRVTGYELGYERPGGLASVRKARGVLYAGTEVELLEDPVYAAKHLNKQLNDFQRLQGRKDLGVRVKNVSTFDAPGVGEEAEGLRATLAYAGLRTHMTLVAFRRGRVVGVASLVRGDRRDAADEMRRIAQRLDARIQGVLAGVIRGRPEAGPRPQAAFRGRERLPSLTLHASDVGPGVTASQQGTRRKDGYVSHQRTFNDVLVGRSHLFALRAETQLYRTESAAALAFRLMKTPDGRRLYARVAMKSFADGVGFKPRDVAVRPLAGVRRDATGLVVTFGLPTGKFRVASVFVRSGRHLQAVTAFCRAESFDPDDLLPLAERARRRLLAA